MNRKDRSAGRADALTGSAKPTVAGSLPSKATGGPAVLEKARLFDSSIVGTSQEAVDFITNILESSTEYSVIAKDLTGKILLWNEGARRLYGYEPGEVIGKVKSSILHTPRDVEAGVPREKLIGADFANYFTEPEKAREGYQRVFSEGFVTDGMWYQP